MFLEIRGASARRGLDNRCEEAVVTNDERAKCASGAHNQTNERRGNMEGRQDRRGLEQAEKEIFR